MWLAPLRVVVATITNDADGYAAEVAKACEAAGLRVAMDRRNEKINYKIREHSEAKVPAILVVGAREAAGRRVAVRRLGGQAPDRSDGRRAGTEGVRTCRCRRSPQQ